MRRRILEAALITVGVGCLGLSSWSVLRYHAFQGDALKLSIPHATKSSSILSPASVEHTMIGRLQIRRVGFDVAMVEGDDEESLALAAGHLPGSALPGHKGNMIVAGHRDSAFWPLRGVRLGDLIEVAGPQRASYRVERTYVVKPENQAPLSDTKDETLTLITCYPFRHVGPAPDRFIVEAKLVRK